MLAFFLAFYLASNLAFYLAFYFGIHLASILTFYSAILSVILAVPTEIWSSRLRSGSAHWDLEFAVGGSRKEEGKRKEVTLIKSRDPHLAGGEKVGEYVSYILHLQQKMKY